MAILVDTGFWKALLDRNQEAIELFELFQLKKVNIILLWPSVYEWMNDSFTRKSLSKSSSDRMIVDEIIDYISIYGIFQDDIALKELALNEMINEKLTNNLSLVDKIIVHFIQLFQIDGFVTNDEVLFNQVLSTRLSLRSDKNYILLQKII